MIFLKFLPSVPLHSFTHSSLTVSTIFARFFLAFHLVALTIINKPKTQGFISYSLDIDQLFFPYLSNRVVLLLSGAVFAALGFKVALEPNLGEALTTRYF